jgi:plastocyanin
LFDQYAGNNPELYIRAGETLAFNLNVTGHPFLIRVSNGGSNYSNGLTHVTTTGTVTTGSSAQGQVAGTLYWKVPAELAGNTYVYQCQVHGGMVGNIVIERPNHDFTNISVAAGTYGNATHYGVVSVAANGRVTSVSTFPVVDSSAIAFSIALG